MNKLIFIGLGLFDENDITIKGLRKAKEADIVFAEFYTSKLMGTTIRALEKKIGKKIKILYRADVEEGRIILDAAKNKTAAFLVPGEPFSATTHIWLRLEAKKKSIKPEIIHAPSIITAAASLSGLQVYKFGRVVTISRGFKGEIPKSFYQGILENKKMGLHSLILLDIDAENDYFMSPNEAIEILLSIEKKERKKLFTVETLMIIVGRAGSEKPLVVAGKIGNLKDLDFGEPLFSMILPGRLHFLEEEMIELIPSPPTISPPLSSNHPSKNSHLSRLPSTQNHQIKHSPQSLQVL